MPNVQSFYDTDTSTWSHVLYDRAGGTAAIIDPVLNYDPASGLVTTTGADTLLAFVGDKQLTLSHVLETHAHADHLTAADYIRSRTGAKIVIGRHIMQVQEHFAAVFNRPQPTDGSQFDVLLDDGDTIAVGDLTVQAIATPGHTADGLTYLCGNAAFIGDTLFAPDVGTARTDFPGGDASVLHESIVRILQLPQHTTLYLAHDYPTQGREPTPVTTIAEQLQSNPHLQHIQDVKRYVELREARNATLGAPRLLYPSLQVNIRAGELPDQESNGTTYFKTPVEAKA